MAKERGFASFTPEQDKAFIKESEKKAPQDPLAGEQRHKQKQKSMNRYGQ